MQKNIAANIANTIKHQLYAMGTEKVWSWGADGFVFGVDKSGKYEMAYLKFIVNGLKLKGTVQILLDEGADTYIVKFYKGDSKEAYKTVDDVYFDDMNDIIDREVEYTGDAESYKKALDESGEGYIKI